MKVDLLYLLEKAARIEQYEVEFYAKEARDQIKNIRVPPWRKRKWTREYERGLSRAKAGQSQAAYHYKRYEEFMLGLLT